MTLKAARDTCFMHDLAVQETWQHNVNTRPGQHQDLEIKRRFFIYLAAPKTLGLSLYIFSRGSVGGGSRVCTYRKAEQNRQRGGLEIDVAVQNSISFFFYMFS